MGVVVEFDIDRAIIVSGGDVVVKGNISNSLIIARGSVIQVKPGPGERRRPGCIHNHIIAGKSVTVFGEEKYNRIVEDEPNPLGYIRWADAPKVEPMKK